MKKMFRTVIVIMMLVASIFTMGCESQQEKFDKLEQKATNVSQACFNHVTVALKRKDFASSIATFEKTDIEREKIYNEMEKVAKGNKELEEKVKIKKERLAKHKKEIEELKQDYIKKGLIK